MEMTSVDLSSPLPPREAQLESPPVLRAQERENRSQRPSSPSKAIYERNERESKLELFETDPLVNVRGLKGVEVLII
ncbi:hypothetical protein KC19_10G084000 [Ceratodon purpureus]|uniref:Uncharacterized protein n=1 Tax=Ceratodon purpureus TaxID=3225 RepID=A0A8T0GLW0_CERPU|nr:hypothetical protein KC19_10G084000 [Ceratodon purpureus]